jgi:ferritin-like metal-binding protein YciE
MYYEGGDMVDKSTFVAWLNDAYAMETALIPILRNHARDAQDDAQARQRIELHAEQTERHAELVKGCVERLGSTTSATKTGLGGVFGMLQSVSTGIFSDELVKNGLADYATEHFEIACYRALQAAAESFGDEHTVAMCREIIRDEQEMADWLAAQIPKLVQRTGAPKRA